MSKILGIDLGTTNSAMAVIETGEPKIIESEEGARTTPSVVSLSKAGDRVVGILAKRQAVTNPENTIFSAKRLVGRSFYDKEVQHDLKELKMFPFKLKEGSNQGIEIKMGEKWHRPEEISAMVLAKLKRDAESRLGAKIDEAIITCPAYFNDSQRQATKNAGEIAGFKVRRILNEPTAAALAYGFNKRKEEKIVVYDFGGGTFDISILEVGADTIEVKGVDGDTHLGGDDLDIIIINWILKEFKKDSGIDVSNDPLAMQRLKEAAEKAKHELSTTIEIEINVPFLTSDANGPKHLLTKMTRAKLEELTKDFVDRSIEITKRALKAVGLKPSDINEVILVGGQTRMPLIQQRVREFFGKEPNKSINPDEVVAVGAAVQAGIMQGEVKDILLLDVTPLSLGIETLGGIFTKIIEKNTTIPVSKSQIFSTAGDSQTSVEIHILQGEREMAAYNKTLGRFILDGIPPAPRGLPQIEVAFDIDANGILSVKARDKATQKEQSIRITASTGLSKEDIEKMKQEAKVHEEDDHQKRELSETKNNADSLIYATEKTLREMGDKLSSEVKKDIEEKLSNLKNIKEENDPREIRTRIQELSEAVQKYGADLYRKTQKNESSGPDSNSDASSPNT